MTEPLLVERRDDGVVLVTLNLPDIRNAMTADLTALWKQTMTDLRFDRSVRCVVVTGAGSAFCSGGDLGWLAEGAEMGPDAVRTRMLPFYEAWLTVRDLEVPTIAYVNGPAVGAGCAVAIACDLRWAAPTARLGVPFTRLGMHSGMATTFLLAEAVGPVKARELLYTGRLVDAAEAERLGLVNGVCSLDEVLATASRIAGAAPIATRLTKAGLKNAKSFAEALAWEAVAQPVTMTTADILEGLAAQRERRTPRFSGL